eukprot:s827_g11.t1
MSHSASQSHIRGFTDLRVLGSRLLRDFLLPIFDATGQTVAKVACTGERMAVLKGWLAELQSLCGRCGSSLQANPAACGRCKQVRYCSRECQQSDWKERHKAGCLPSSESLSGARHQVTEVTQFQTLQLDCRYSFVAEHNSPQLKTDPALCQQLQEAIQSFTLQPKEKAPKKATGCQAELDPVLSEQLQEAFESLGLPLAPQEKRPAPSDRRIDQVTIDTRGLAESLESSRHFLDMTNGLMGWISKVTAKDVESCVARVLKNLERPRKAAERLIGDLLPELSLPQPWVTFRSSKGKLFFLNPVSRSTTWRHPLEPALQEMGVLCKSLLELDDSWRSQLLSGQRETIDAERCPQLRWWADQEEQQQLSSWQLISPGLWQHVDSSETSSRDPSHEISASSQLKRLALSKLQNPRSTQEARRTTRGDAPANTPGGLGDEAG